MEEKKKYLSWDKLQEYDILIKDEINKRDSAILDEAKKDIIFVEGGATLALTEVFGEAPYTIEVSSEEENFFATDIEYDNSNSELSSTSVQGAIDELKTLVKVAPAGNDYSTYRIRNIAILSEVPTSMNDGDVALVYHKEG